MATKKKYNFDDKVNYWENKTASENVGDAFGAMQDEAMRNYKIDAGFGDTYDKTYDYNYNPKYESKLQQLRNKRENFRDFSYDPYQDDAYKSLAKVYSRNAERATSNALAQAAAANGGRVSSGVGTAMALAYQDKMAQLEGEIPALREAAYQKYQDEYNRLNDAMNDYLTADATDYSRWSDRYGRLYQGLRDRADDAYRNEQNSILREQNEISRARTDADIASMKYADARDASEFLGYATEDFARLTGVDPKTMSADEQNAFREYQLQIGQAIGKFPASVLASYGMDVSGIVDSKGFVNTVDLTDAQLNFLLSANNKDSAASSRDWITKFYGQDEILNPGGGKKGPQLEFDAYGMYYTTSGGDKVYVGMSGGYGNDNTTPTNTTPTSLTDASTNNLYSNGGGNASVGGGNTTTPSSPQEQIMNQRTDQGKAMKAEELYNNGQISYAEYEDILNRMS